MAHLRIADAAGQLGQRGYCLLHLFRGGDRGVARHAADGHRAARDRDAGEPVDGGEIDDVGRFVETQFEGR